MQSRRFVGVRFELANISSKICVQCGRKFYIHKHNITMSEKREWTNKEVLSLIEAFKERSCLWDKIHEDYKLVSKKNNAWLELANMYEIEVYELKKKMSSLLSSLRRERQKQENLKPDGRNYRSSWFAFNSLYFVPRKRRERKCRIILGIVSITANNFRCTRVLYSSRAITWFSNLFFQFYKFFDLQKFWDLSYKNCFWE